MEKDARNAGEKAQDEFTKHSEKLAQILGIPPEMTFCKCLKFNLKKSLENAPVIHIDELNVARK